MHIRKGLIQKHRVVICNRDTHQIGAGQGVTFGNFLSRRAWKMKMVVQALRILREIGGFHDKVLTFPPTDRMALLK